jgi:regulator of chromosome condensation
MEQVLSCGSGECEQLGIPDVFIARMPRAVTLPEEICLIACGSMHTLALSTEGRVYSWGCNDDGALGRSGAENSPGIVTGVQSVNKLDAGDSHSVAISQLLKTVYTWGTYRNSEGNMALANRFPVQITQFANSKKIADVVCGGNHSLVLVDGKVYAWGDSEFGQIGRQPRSRRSVANSLLVESIGAKNVTAIYSGRNHSFYRAYDKIYGWGLNNYGQLGDGTTDTGYMPHEIPGLSEYSILDIRGGENHTIALTTTNTVLVWGRNDDYQLGLNSVTDSLVPQVLNFNGEVKQIVAGSHFNFILTNKKRVYSWGYGDCYTLMNGKEKNVSMPTLLAWSVGKPIDLISAGSQHVTLLRNSGTLNLPSLQITQLKTRQKAQTTPKKKRIKS